MMVDTLLDLEDQQQMSEGSQAGLLESLPWMRKGNLAVLAQPWMMGGNQRGQRGQEAQHWMEVAVADQQGVLSGGEVDLAVTSGVLVWTWVAFLTAHLVALMAVQSLYGPQVLLALAVALEAAVEHCLEELVHELGLGERVSGSNQGLMKQEESGQSYHLVALWEYH